MCLDTAGRAPCARHTGASAIVATRLGTARRRRHAVVTEGRTRPFDDGVTG